MSAGEISRLLAEKHADLDKYNHSLEDLQKRLAQTERDMQLALAQEKKAHDENVNRLKGEKDRQRAELELEAEYLKQSYNTLQVAMEKKTMAEHDRQKKIALLEEEKSILSEKINNLNLELASANEAYRRLKRDSQAEQEQDSRSLQSELESIRSRFARTNKECRNQITDGDTEQQSEVAKREQRLMQGERKDSDENMNELENELRQHRRKIDNDVFKKSLDFFFKD